MSEWILAITALLALAVGFLLGFLIRRYAIQGKIKQQQQRVEGLVGKAEKEASEIVMGAKDEALKIRNAAEQELERRRVGLRREEERIQRRREKLNPLAVPIVPGGGPVSRAAAGCAPPRAGGLRGAAAALAPRHFEL